MHDAISYKRFSSPSQARGDSERRQTDLAVEYCERHSLRLIDTYLDAGLSGFTAQHLSDRGALRSLLDAAKAGRFRPRTHLIVESLDRLSRQEISAAVRLFLDILDLGLVIVTLVDGEQVFTKERVDNDLSAIVIVIVLLSRANNESRVKRERALQSHRARRQKARETKIPMSTNSPPWLAVEGTGGDRRFVVNKQRAQLVEQIFNLCISGLGEHRIVSYLNQRRVPNFTQAPRWRGSAVARLLRNPAVFGLYQPCFSVMEDGKKRRAPDPDGPIDDYFPPILTKELFDRVQRVRAGRLVPRPDGGVTRNTNLFTGIGHCAACGATLYLARSARGYHYLKCGRGYDWACSNHLGFPYRKLEAVFLALDHLVGFVRRVLVRRSAEDLSASGDVPSDRQSTVHPDSGYGGRSDAEYVERDGFFVRFATAKVLMGSPLLSDALEARVTLLSEVRRFFDGVVLHPNRLVTLHLRPDTEGCRLAFIVGGDGLLGIQIKAGTGTVGFIGGASCAGFVRPVKSGIGKTVDDEMRWQPRELDDALEHVRIINLPNGDWEAVALNNPMHMAEYVGQAERILAANIGGQNRRAQAPQHFTVTEFQG